MKTDLYKLKSVPGVSIEVPKGCVNEAEVYISSVMKCGANKITSITKHPYASDDDIYELADQLHNTPEENQMINKMLQDMIVLHISVYSLSFKERDSGEAKRRKNSLLKIIEKLETGQPL
jgi:hypothetical protein